MPYHTRTICLLTLALITSASWSMSARAKDLVWGINGHPFNNYRGVSDAQQLDYIKDLGLTSYRVDIVDERSVFRLKELARSAAQRGITILPVITPNISLALGTPNEIYRRSFERAVAIVTPLKNEIRVWELGNELENFAIIRACEKRDNGQIYNCQWGPAGGVSPLDYYGPRWAKVSAMLRGLSDGVKSVDPTIKRAMGTAGWGHTGAFERMRADGLEWDISIWHMYGQDPEWAFKILSGYGKPIWVTEFNHPGGSSNGAQAQASGLIRQMLRLRELARKYAVEAAHIYELMDEPYWAPSYEAVMGLVTLVSTGNDQWRAGEPKLAYKAVRDLLSGKPISAHLLEVAAGPAQIQRNCALATPTDGNRDLPLRVAYAYCLLLGREPDGDGMRGWLEHLRKLSQLDGMLEGIATSSEFNERYRSNHLTNAEFVALLYRLLLMREPDGGGLAEYSSALDSKKVDRAAIIQSFFNSYEFKVNHPLLSAPLGTAGEAVR